MQRILIVEDEQKTGRYLQQGILQLMFSSRSFAVTAEVNSWLTDSVMMTS